MLASSTLPLSFCARFVALYLAGAPLICCSKLSGSQAVRCTFRFFGAVFSTGGGHSLFVCEMNYNVGLNDAIEEARTLGPVLRLSSCSCYLSSSCSLSLFGGVSDSPR